MDLIAVKRKKKKHAEISWQASAAKDDCAAAHRYLSLLFQESEARQVAEKFCTAPVVMFAAKDLLRASQTHLLENENPQVEKTLQDIKKGKPLSPVLLVRGNAALGVTVTIADGYHRICASWHWDEESPVACCVVSNKLSKTGK